MADTKGEWVVQGDLASGSVHISCNASVATTGNVSCDNNKVIIGGESYDDTEVKQAIKDLETNKSTVITGNWDDSTDTVTNTAGGTNWQGLDKDGKFYSENYVGDELKSSFEVDLVTEEELKSVNDRITANSETISQEGLIRAESDERLAEGIEIARDEAAVADAKASDALDMAKANANTNVTQSAEIAKNTADIAKATKDQFNGGVVTLPEGYRAVAIDNGTSTQGIVRIDKLDTEGKVIEQTFHTVSEQTVFKNPKGDGKFGTATVNGVSKENLAENVHKVETLNQNKVLSDANGYTDSKVTELDDKFTADQDRQDKQHNDYVETQKEVDRLQSVETSSNTKRVTTVENRMTAAEQELYSTTARSISNEKRIEKVEGRVSSLENDVAGMKKGMAAITAMTNLVDPKFAGETTISVGVGYAQSHTAIALGLTHNVSDNVAVKGAVATDTQFDEVVASGSIGYSF